MISSLALLRLFLIAFYKNILGVKQISIGVIISIILCG